MICCNFIHLKHERLELSCSSMSSMLMAMTIRSLYIRLSFSFACKSHAKFEFMLHCSGFISYIGGGGGVIITRNNSLENSKENLTNSK